VDVDSGERDKEPVDADGEEVGASEPPEVALAREEVNLLLAEQQKTAALKVRERGGAQRAVTGMALMI
jgi:kinesin family protein 18/19